MKKLRSVYKGKVSITLAHFCSNTSVPMSKSRAWCFTLNNYSGSDETLIQSRCDEDLAIVYLIYGRETGESGTPHLQGYVYFKSPRSLSGLKRNFLETAHWEPARGTPKQASDYCRKDDEDAFEYGELPSQGKRSDIRSVLSAIEDGERSAKRLRASHPEVCAKFPQFVRQVLIDTRPPPACPVITLRPWQSDVIEFIRLPASDREIHFFVDQAGNAGKSTFCSYVEALFPNVQVIKPGRYQDMAFELDEETKILLVDCPRSRAEVLQYQFLEDVKDGRVTCSKYQSFQKRLSSCHVLVFMNEHPDALKLSHDRFKIKVL